jgi:hypothetical protein
MIRRLTSRQTAHDSGRRALTVTQILTTLTMGLLVGASAAMATAGQNQPVAPANSPWLPWLGCWQLVEETGALAARPDNARHFADRVVVCLSQAETAGANASGIAVTTIADGTPVLIETLVADGAQHPVEEAACEGWRRNTWSGDGARLFTRAELACDDDGTRRVSGVGLMTSPVTWLDIQLIETGGRDAVTVRRYQRVSASTTVDAGATPLPDDILDRARTAARLASTSELSIDDVIEADQAIEPAVVEAMLIETRAAFALDRHALIQLDDSGVSAGVIDLMVALSFPDEFVVDRPVARITSSYGGGGFGFADSFSPYSYDRWYPYYASPFGYYYGWSAYNSLYNFGPTASYPIAPSQNAVGSGGRAYQGRGYTNVNLRQPAPTGRARPRGTTGKGTSTTQASSRGGSSSGSSGGGQATQGGYTSGGSTGRTARPRYR